MDRAQAAPRNAGQMLPDGSSLSQKEIPRAASTLPAGRPR